MLPKMKKPSLALVLYDEPYAVFGFGRSFLEAVRRLPGDAVEIREHRDRAGDVAFLSVRIARPHRLAYRDGFEVTLR